MTTAAAAPELDDYATPSRGLTARALRRFARQPTAVTALVVVVAIFVAGALSHVLAPNGWNAINLAPNAVHLSPSFAHPFGTDALGRDMLVRTLYGVRTTEEVALAAALLATLVGVAAGTLAGYYGGWLDAVLMRLADLVTALPAILLVLAVLVYLGEAYPRYLIGTFTAIMWAVVARVVRAHVASLRVSEFVEAARAGGASDLRIAFRHLLPNAGGTILVAATALVSQIVLIDATVEFFSLGLPAAIVPSLGNLVSDVIQEHFTTNAFPNTGWWVWVFPCAVLVLILVCVNLIGDALDTAFNPSARRV
jgi:ABC-type dipeptide/oligopeptide/nickel transport system permease subunit